MNRILVLDISEYKIVLYLLSSLKTQTPDANQLEIVVISSAE